MVLEPNHLSVEKYTLFGYTTEGVWVEYLGVQDYKKVKYIYIRHMRRTGTKKRCNNLVK